MNDTTLPGHNPGCRCDRCNQEHLRLGRLDIILERNVGRFAEVEFQTGHGTVTRLFGPTFRHAGHFAITSQTQTYLLKGRTLNYVKPSNTPNRNCIVIPRSVPARRPLQVTTEELHIIAKAHAELVHLP